MIYTQIETATGKRNKFEIDQIHNYCDLYEFINDLNWRQCKFIREKEGFKYPKYIYIA
jgi:hypothetical protein